MAWVDRNQGFLLEDLMAQRHGIGVVEDLGLADS